MKGVTDKLATDAGNGNKSRGQLGQRLRDGLTMLLMPNQSIRRVEAAQDGRTPQLIIHV